MVTSEQRSLVLKDRVIKLLENSVFTYPEDDDKVWLKLQQKSIIQLTCDKNHTLPLEIYDLLFTDPYECKKCKADAKYGIEIAKKVAIQRNGKCLSDTYTGSGCILTWECFYKHTWPASYKHVVSDESWCPDCHFSM